MPLTRHLYEIDEVTAALQLCLRRGGARALFWTWELVVSDESLAAFNAIRHAWLLWGGGHDPSLITAHQPPAATDAAAWILLTDRVAAAITAAGTLTADKLLPRAAPSHRIAAPAYQRRVATAFATAVADQEGIPRAEAAAFWETLATAPRLLALWLIQAGSERLCADSIWLAIQMIAALYPQPIRTAVAALRTAATPHPESQVLHQTAAILALRVSPETATATPSATSLRDWNTWTALVDNPRAARIHAIPADALHAQTTRGSLSAKYTNDADIHNPVALLPAACRWWRTQTATAGFQVDPLTEAVAWSSDEALEAFYSRYFPVLIDIPDEWSAADRAKSHGRGVQETASPAPAPTLLEESVDDAVWLAAILVKDHPHGDC
jgi:hypothetical protein